MKKTIPARMGMTKEGKALLSTFGSGFFSKPVKFERVPEEAFELSRRRGTHCVM